MVCDIRTFVLVAAGAQPLSPRQLCIIYWLSEIESFLDTRADEYYVAGVEDRVSHRMSQTPT
jgi:hypothetical protein